MEIGLIVALPSVALLYLGDASGAISMPLPLGFVGIPSRDTSVLAVGQLVVIGPAAETVLLVLLIRLISFATAGALIVASLTGLAFAIVHGLASALLGIGAFWAFFVFTCAYLAWRERSFWSGYVAAFIPHAFTNLVLLLIAWTTTNAA
jgi:hypothetical protein